MYYNPYWFVEFHLGLERHFAVLDATTSELKIDPKELLDSKKQVPIPFDELNLDNRNGFKKENLRYAKINEPKEAKELINYKLKYLYPKKDYFLADPHLINVPVWEFKVKDKKLIVFGNDPNYKETVLKMLKENFTKKEKTKTQLFAEIIGEIKNPKDLIKDFKVVVKKTNKWVIIITLIIIIVIIYFIITKILGHITTTI